MTTTKHSAFAWMLVVAATFVVSLSTIFVPPTLAQSSYAGDNAVWSSTSAQTYAHSFIDASVVSGTGGHTDVCARINAALINLADTTNHSWYGTAALIDARGVPVGTSNPCSMSPWGGTAANGPPATILLPAGTIAITNQWTLPNGTRIIGQGAGAPGASTTIIQAESGFGGTASMIQMGSSTACPTSGCAGVSVEDLTLDGNLNGSGGSYGTIGITNGQSQNFSYVRRVNLYQISGTALKIWNKAQNSGPYTDIGCAPGSAAGSSTNCAQILNIVTHGIHGMTCSGPSTPTSTAAILLDAPNNTLEDIRIQGFNEGVVIGSNSTVTNPAQSDVLLNITGGTGVQNLIHISSTKPPSDLSIMAVNKNGSNTTILDDVAGPTITDASVALYVLGEQLTTGVYSRFTSSKSQPSWGVGTSLPSSCINGSIFSSTNGTNMHYLYVCKGGIWAGL